VYKEDKNVHRAAAKYLAQSINYLEATSFQLPALVPNSRMRVNRIDALCITLELTIL